MTKFIKLRQVGGAEAGDPLFLGTVHLTSRAMVFWGKKFLSGILKEIFFLSVTWAYKKFLSVISALKMIVFA